MTGLLYLLNVVCSAGQSALGKQYARGGGEASTFNRNKAVSGLVLFVVLGCIQGFSLHWPTVLLGAAYGVSLCISMHTGFKALSSGPMALTSIIASFSLLIPVVFGLCFWHESLTIWGVCGIVLILFSIVLINGRKGGSLSGTWLLYALTTLLTNGICSVIQKYHQIQFPALYRTEFMVFALLSVSVILCVRPGADRPGGKKPVVSALGVLSGIMNCSANYIVLYLAATENASVLFPIVSVANIAVVWLISLVFFKEKLTVRQTMGLVLGAVSVMLLKI